MSLFHPTTNWQQINQWIKTLAKDIFIGDCVIWDPQQKIVVDENQSLCSTGDQSTFDGISQEETIKVIFFYETSHQPICTLKSTWVYHLLNNEQLLRQLNLKISPQNCVLMLNQTDDRILLQDDMRYPVCHYSCADDQPICFRISILVSILKYDDQKQLQIPLPNRDFTIEQLLGKTGMSIDIYKYLASNATHEIISNNQNLSILTEVNFILVKENETCIVQIENVQEVQLIDVVNNETDGRYIISATIADVCKRKNIDTSYQYLLYSDDFVPSMNTPLASFRSAILYFKLINDNLPVTLTVSNDEEKQITTFHCSASMSIKRLCQIVCQLFGVNDLYYELTYEGYQLDDDILLDDMDSSKTDYEFKLNCKATLKSKITYENQTLILPCNDITLLSTVMKEVCERFHIPEDRYQMYELVIMDEDQRQIDLDTPVGDVLSLLPDDTTLIPLQLKETNK
jgi:hypothetical protein